MSLGGVFQNIFFTTKYLFSLFHRIDAALLCERTALNVCFFLLYRYDDPYTLPCLHTFCRKCITGWLNVNAICPKCREPYSVADLKQFFEFNEMINCARAGKTTFCEECKMPAASPVKCDHCAKAMCSACYTRHTVEVHFPNVPGPDFPFVYFKLIYFLLFHCLIIKVQ